MADSTSERRIDITSFAQSDGLGVMQVAALKALLKLMRPPPTHATVREWRHWLREALEAVVTS